MPVFFVYRSFDHGPTGKYLRRFDDDTVLEWFTSRWEHLAITDYDQADERLLEAVGCGGWFLVNPFHHAAEDGLPPPKSMKSLLGLVRQCADGECFGSSHSLQLFTEDDGEGGAIFYFDGHFLEKYARLASYLLHEDWRLPSGAGEGGFEPAAETQALRAGSGEGTTYVVLLERESKYPLDDLEPAYRIDGVRLPGLARHLCSSPPFEGEGEYGWK